MSVFSLNTSIAIVQRCLPNHPKAEDAPLTCEVQMRDVLCKPMAAAALATPRVYGEGVAEDDKAANRMRQFIDAMFGDGKDFPDRFVGFGQIEIVHVFNAVHEVTFGDLGPHKVHRLDKIRMHIEGGHDQAVKVDFSIHLEDPPTELIAYLHERTNRSVEIVLTQSRDQIEEMIAAREGMSAPTRLPNLELDFEANASRDADQINQAAESLSESAEVPIKTKRKAPTKKAAGKRAAKKKAAA